MRKITIELNVPDNASFCAIDYPGQVYGDRPRLAFFDRDGKIIAARSPTEGELALLQSELNKQPRRTALPRDLAEAIKSSRMDPKYDHLNALLDEQRASPPAQTDR